MQDHPDQALFRTQNPFGVYQRRSQALLTIPMGLVARAANSGINLTASVKAGFGDRWQGLHVGGGQGVSTGRFTRPKVERRNLLDSPNNHRIGGTTQCRQSVGFSGQLRLLNSRSRGSLGRHRNQANKSVEQGRQRPLVLLELRRQVQRRRDLSGTSRGPDAARQLRHQRRMVLLVRPALGVTEQLGQECQFAPFEPADRRILTQRRRRTGH